MRIKMMLLSVWRKLVDVVQLLSTSQKRNEYRSNTRSRFSRRYRRHVCVICGISIAIVASTLYLTHSPKYPTGELQLPANLQKYKKPSLPDKENRLIDNAPANVVNKQAVIEEKHFATSQVKHIAFLKVHKTGSSSVQHSFLRYGDSRNLTFIIASKENNECDGYLNCISFSNTLHDRNILPPPTDKSYDILCSHVIYDRLAFRKYLPPDTKYIGIVRDPVRRLESAINFFRPFPNVSLSQYARNILKYHDPMTNNRMAFEFGFKAEWFPSPTHVTLSDIERVKVNEYVDLIMNDFDIILVNERLDESLVLMRRLLGWSLQDILYQNVLVRPHDHFRAEDIDSVRKYLYLDDILYERAANILNVKLSQANSDFHDEVETFKLLNKNIATFCECKNMESDAFLTIPATLWNGGFHVNRAFCDTMAITEELYLRILRVRQTGNSTMEDFERSRWTKRRLERCWIDKWRDFYQS